MGTVNGWYSVEAQKINKKMKMLKKNKEFQRICKKKKKS